MTPAIIIAIGIGIATALVVALVAARQAGGTGSEELYGHELDAPDRVSGQRRARPGVRQRAVLALVAAALAALGAGLATGLCHGTH